MDLQWTIYLKRRGAEGKVTLCTFRRPVRGATVADFGLSTSKGRERLWPKTRLMTALLVVRVVPHNITQRFTATDPPYRQRKGSVVAAAERNEGLLSCVALTRLVAYRNACFLRSRVGRGLP